ncbi:MAG: diadenylate cyclase CdaA [Candidatus Margulisbacteria bacterium]|nr:diadenylate cyclase CdaA [Candidatus Margulisiibacteriota bacterium]
MKFSLPIPLSIIDIIDILIVSFLVYQILLWFKGTRTLQLLRGLVLIFAFYIISQLTGLATINWLLQKLTAIIVITLIIVFQPELRKALERLGRGKFFSEFIFSGSGKSLGFLNQVIKAVEELSKTKTGAIIAIERNTGLNEFIESGIQVDALVNNDLIVSTFNKASPLHDGAMMIQGNRIAAASCLFPLSESHLIDKRLGTRHRAALGLSEISDAIIIVVSEETGAISLAENGILTRFLTKETLEERMLNIYKNDFRLEGFNFINWFSTHSASIKEELVTIKKKKKK